MFKKIKKSVQDWAFDTDGVNERKKEAINQILPLIEEIENIWYVSLTNSSLLNQKQKAQMDLLYATSGNSLLLEQYNKGVLNNSRFHSLEELLVDIKDLTNKNNIRMSDKDLLTATECVMELCKIDIITEQSKKQVYAQNATKIYNNLMIINAIQKKYMDLSNFIGYPDNLDEILGKNGEKIKDGNPAALEYIDKIIGLGNKFKVDLSLINAREISRR